MLQNAYFLAKSVPIQPKTSDILPKFCQNGNYPTGPDMGAAHQDLFLFAHGGGLYPEDYENPALFYDQIAHAGGRNAKKIRKIRKWNARNAKCEWFVLLQLFRNFS